MRVTVDALRTRYLAMEDGQLLALASRDLTDEARAALDEVMAQRALLSSPATAAITQRKPMPPEAPQPSLVAVMKAWRRLNQTFLIPILFLALVGLLKVTGLLDLFDGARFMAELWALSFMGVVMYFQIRLFMLVAALKKSVGKWLLIWFLAPFSTLIIYCVMWDSVRVLRHRAQLAGSDSV